MEIIKIISISAFSIAAFLAYLILSFVLLKDLYLVLSSFYKIEKGIEKIKIDEIILGGCAILAAFIYLKTRQQIYLWPSLVLLVSCFALKARRRLGEKENS